MKRNLFSLGLIVSIAVVGTVAWTMTVRAGYESAPYEVIESDGDIEIREYPDLVLATTRTNRDSQGRDGSFMRLFRYISGANSADQKIAMTTPVFMEGKIDRSDSSMGFVMPQEVVIDAVPDPKGDGVTIRKRIGGQFAVIRFSGQLDVELAKREESRLREWMSDRGLSGESNAEVAGYAPPFTPGPLRRNEILIRLSPPGIEYQPATPEKE